MYSRRRRTQGVYMNAKPNSFKNFLMKGIIEEFKREKDTKAIIENIKRLIEEEEFYSIEPEDMKEILQKSSFDIGREGKFIKTLIHNIIDKYGEEGLGIVKYIECGNIEIDFESDNESDKNTVMEIKTLIAILEELTEIPIIRETCKYLSKSMNMNKDKSKKRNKDEESGIIVDWEKQFREEEEKNKELEKQLKEVRIKYKAMHSTLQKKIPHEREYSKKEIKTIFEIFEKRDLKKATKVLTKDPSLIFIRNKKKDTPLNIASEDGWIEGVELLMDLGVGVDGLIESVDYNLNTPLIEASKRGELEVIKYLIEKGANIEARSLDGCTPLIKACYWDRLEVVKYLIEKGANIEAKDGSGGTPLMMASSEGKLEVVKYLIEIGANIEAKDNKGNTPLIEASENGKLEVVKYLIEKGANIEAKDKDGYTPLIKASSGWNKLYIVKYLVENGANIEAKDNKGYTPLALASSHGELEVVKYLIEKGANIEAKNNDGDTALKASKNQKQKEVEEYLKSIGAKE